ncbi:serine carboxypeptidase-like 29 isoform X2 [Arachis ipaensis]|uniref:serine carboxypeptidase-like 29 isoform X2 n=1 Tax=Arachis ipaensis TaxID=130454 RepID=UPI0007AF8C15|nr:serine carboxypeptidase-like 29 isoform X2 [Arachis ipaensis]
MGWSQVITLTTLVVGAMAITVTCSPFVQQKLDKVGKLPGQSFAIKFQHYSGYVTVNEEAGRALFYWFMEADQDPQTKPLLLWLNGGPGCSSIAFGEAEEIGPFHINPDGNTLYLNPYSWNQAEDSLTFLLKWFERFPQYKGRDFFIAGESYAGHYVPQLSQAILKYNSETKKNAINLKGYLVGNALTDDFHDHLGVAQFMWASGLISDQTYKLLNQCDSESFIHPSNSCNQAFENADVELGNIDPYSIFTSLCPGNVSQTKQLLRRKHRFGRLNEGYDPCTEKHSTAYFNLPEVQKALHVDQDHKPSKWETCSETININWKDSPSTVLDVYHELIGSGLRIWMFSGDTDSVLPVTSTRYSIDALKLPTVSPWRPWYDEGQVGGWTQEYDGLTFVAVRGAGHEVPLHRPKLALSLFKAFIAGTSMPTLQLVSDS